MNISKFADTKIRLFLFQPSHPGYARSDSQNSFGYPPMPRDIPQQQPQPTAQPQAMQQQQTAQPQAMQQQHRLQSQNDFSNIPTQDENCMSYPQIIEILITVGEKRYVVRQ